MWHTFFLGLPHLIVSYGVIAVVLATRMPLDRPFTIGGKLSHPLRLLLLFLGAVVGVRVLFNGSIPHWEVIWRILYTVEMVATAWITLQTPYLLVGFYNLPRPSGKDLDRGFFAISAVVSVGVLLGTIRNPRFWAIVRLGNALPAVLTLYTLRLFHRHTRPGGPNGSRGLVGYQSLKHLEWLYIIAMMAAAFGQACRPMPQHPSILDYFCQALRELNYVDTLTWLRVLMHSMFVNVLDETYQSRREAPGEADEHHRVELQLVGV